MAAGPEAVVRGHRRAAPLVVDTMAARLGASASSRARLSRQCVKLGQLLKATIDIAPTRCVCPSRAQMLNMFSI